MIGQAEVVVGAEIQHRATVGEFDLGRLRRSDDAFGLEQAGGTDLVEGVGVALGQFHDSTTLPDLPPSIRSKPFWNSSIGS